ncbi:SWIM zinc finger family protein [Nonomuraea sp. NEAU-A123]|uniref:SWIM zinc finger family protein n=1 Tax=Nonomuraea sp. NEAU-A123 TaxID=2839649 RepID=UPI001BE3F5C3|nr:SWIM zinc finger family protein [Nonomuraea sp. NEAU-A123]MBT2232438.1 SWIM zinc finger family protein [Nonomuraea sp. NEAU-A123]
MNSPTITFVSSAAGQLPPVAPQVVAAAVEGLTSRLRKKLDAAIEQYAAVPVAVDDEGIRISCGEDAVVTLSPGPSGAIVDDGQARCSCLLAPRCLHRAAVLSACPVADPEPIGTAGSSGAGDDPLGADAVAGFAPDGAVTDPAAALGTAGSGNAQATRTGSRATQATGEDTAKGAAPDGAQAAAGPGAGQAATAGTGAGQAATAGQAVTAGSGAAQAPGVAQVAAAASLWRAAAAILATGAPAAGAVPQAELLRAAHTARLAGLPKAEAAALRVVRGLRAARARHDGHRLADLVSALRELLLTAGRLAGADPDPSLVGSVRRSYQPGGSLRVYGVFREPVISATGYGGVVTHLVTDDGRWFSVADVKPGGPARARGAATAPVSIGPAMLNHAQLARAGLLITGATVSPDGRLGAGGGVRATPVSGMSWTAGPMAALFARPLAEAVGPRLSGHAWSESDTEDKAREPVGCDLVIVGAAGDHVLARELLPAHDQPDILGRQPAEQTPVRPVGPLIRLVPAAHHPDLAHVANLQRLASRPGLVVRVVGRVDPDRAATLRPLAVGPVPGAEATLRLPAEWQDRVDLGYDRLQGSHLPPPEACLPGQTEVGAEVDPVASAPLWRVRRLVELAVSGGRRAVAESARNGDSHAPLRRAGFRTAAELAATLTAEADRRTRDVFGRLADSGPDRYAWAWLAAATHLAATERAMIQSSWQADHLL